MNRPAKAFALDLRSAVIAIPEHIEGIARIRMPWSGGVFSVDSVESLLALREAIDYALGPALTIYWETPVNIATGATLDAHARAHDLERKLDETDQELRDRILRRPL